MVTVKLPLGEQTGLFILSPLFPGIRRPRFYSTSCFLRISISEKNTSIEVNKLTPQNESSPRGRRLFYKGTTSCQR